WHYLWVDNNSRCSVGTKSDDTGVEAPPHSKANWLTYTSTNPLCQLTRLASDLHYHQPGWPRP
ncbi:hypothetical protein, partial [Ferrimicrobium sp.]|uniref:hypothetical protein n=1 Tax=Ferrimicrobium sp. TaxID=2926050 RepID=UPI00262E8607